MIPLASAVQVIGSMKINVSLGQLIVGAMVSRIHIKWSLSIWLPWMSSMSMVIWTTVSCVNTMPAGGHMVLVQALQSVTVKESRRSGKAIWQLASR